MSGDQDLKQLLAEMEALKHRVAHLEGYVLPGSESDRTSVQGKSTPEMKGPEPPSPQEPRVPLSHRLSEEFIGGQLLNRVGALIVVGAVAYFLKWSFDNDIIGELGRCVLGLAVGTASLFGGHIYFRRGYKMFSQGLIGAGIAIIYLATYAALNYYHLIQAYPAFAVMFLTTIAAGVIAAVDDMPGAALLAAVGGFLTPLLINAHNVWMVPLLTYVFILDLGILFLANYRHWLWLNLLALAGTLLLTLLAYFQMHWQSWTGQAYLAAFLLLFTVVSILYNHRSRSDNPVLLLLCNIVFGSFTFFNLRLVMQDWLGIVCLILAALCLLCFYGTRIYKIGTDFGAHTLLIIALVYSVLVWPAQLRGVYNLLAWLAVAAACLYYSRFRRSLPAFLVALAILVAAGLALNIEHHPRPFTNDTSVILCFSVLDWGWALWVARKNYAGHRWLLAGLAMITAGILFFLLDYDIGNAIYYYQANRSMSFLVPISWAILSSLLLWIGIRRDQSDVRLFSLLLYGVVLVRTVFYELNQLDIIFKILMLLVVGLIALAISFSYQKRMKGVVPK